jgi:fructoselysine-6-P-deglycase FrlB-like protein
LEFRKAPQAPSGQKELPRNHFAIGSPFRVDVEAQAQALLDLDQAPVSLGLYPLVHAHHDRIILTGVGASHAVALPSWHRFVSRGRAAWWIDAGSLLDQTELVTPDSVLIVTSRSGTSAEVIALAEMHGQTPWPAALVAVTDNRTSPLALAADCDVLIRSRSSGSPKGFLNALVAHDYVASMILGEDNDDVSTTARAVAATTSPTVFSEVAARIAANPDSRLIYIGFREHAATALYAALLTHESTGITAEAYVGRQYRNSPRQRADINLTAVLFGGCNGDDAAPQRLANNLVAAGATVIVIGTVDVIGSTCIRTPVSHLSAQLAHGVVLAEHFVSSLGAELGPNATS